MDTIATTATTLSAADHARAMADYSRAGEARARALGNRGPIRFGAARAIADPRGPLVFAGLAWLLVPPAAPAAPISSA